MRYLRYIALLGILLVPATYSRAQVSLGFSVGGPAYGGYDGYMLNRPAPTDTTTTILTLARPTDITAQIGSITASSLASVPGTVGARAVAADTGATIGDTAWLRLSWWIWISRRLRVPRWLRLPRRIWSRRVWIPWRWWRISWQQPGLCRRWRIPRWRWWWLPWRWWWIPRSGGGGGYHGGGVVVHGGGGGGSTGRRWRCIHGGGGGGHGGGHR